MKLEQVMKNRKPRDEMCVERFIDTPKTSGISISLHICFILFTGWLVPMDICGSFH